MSEKIYRVQMNSNGMPNFATAVEVAGRPQGEWIFVPEIICSDIGVYSAGYTCSVCEKDYFKVDGMHYCPNCGARMKGADDE